MSRSCFILYLILFVIVFGLSLNSFAQYKAGRDNYVFTIDSLTKRIDHLQSAIPKLQESRNLQFHNTKRELDHTIFLKSYYEYLGDEELDQAKSIVEKRLERAEYRNDGLSIAFYNKYKKNIYDQIKYQRMYYQQLFEKEKVFKKNFDSYLKDGTMDSYHRARRMTVLSIKYAKENQLTETEKYLHKYQIYLDAVIFDYNSQFDLEKLSGNPDAFNKVFLPLVSADSLDQIKKAEELVNHCYAYTSGLTRNFDTLFYRKNRLLVASAISDYYDRAGNRYTGNNSDQMVVARIDTLNPQGVYKWHNFIVVINEFNPKYTAPNLKKGEAIMESDKKLFDYIRRQRIARISNTYKVYGTKFLPFKNGDKIEEYLYNSDTKQWQYMICYETIEDSNFTASVRKYMPPLLFKQENDLVK